MNKEKLKQWRDLESPVAKANKECNDYAMKLHDKYGNNYLKHCTTSEYVTWFNLADEYVKQKRLNKC